MARSIRRDSRRDRDVESRDRDVGKFFRDETLPHLETSGDRDRERNPEPEADVVHGVYPSAAAKFYDGAGNPPKKIRREPPATE